MVTDRNPDVNSTLTINDGKHKRMSNEEFDKVKKTMVGTCDLCGGTFSDLMTHLRKHYYDKPFLCRSCNLSFKTEEELNVHKTSCEEQKKLPFPCSVCMTLNCVNLEHGRMQVKQVQQVQTQEMQYEEIPKKTYKCLGCKRQFDLYKQWKAHCGFCTSQSRLHKCPNCKKCYGLLILLRIHQIHCKKEMENDFSCDYCHEKLDNKSYLVTHVLRKHKETVEITLESLLNESKQLKKNAERAAAMKMPIIKLFKNQ